MRFAFTADQIGLAEGVRAVLDERCPPSVVRSVWNETTNQSRTDEPPPDEEWTEKTAAGELWRALADLGLLGALVPEQLGGLGLNELDLVLGLEQSGRAAVPVPLVETAVVAVRLLVGTPHQEQLIHLATGSRRLSAALDGSFLVPWAGFCDRLLVDHGPAVYLVPVAESVIEPVPTVDRARPLARLSLRLNGPANLRPVLVTDDPARIASARRAGMLATAAQLIGLAERMLAMTVTYVKERHQFGVPVGSFQAVKHALADALLALELARPLVYTAAWAHVHDRGQATRDVAAAKVRAGEAAGLVARTALQAHGGMGYTQEHDLHLWLKRTWALQASWGHAGPLRAQIAQALNLTPSTRGIPPPFGRSVPPHGSPGEAGIRA